MRLFAALIAITLFVSGTVAGATPPIDPVECAADAPADPCIRALIERSQSQDRPAASVAEGFARRAYDLAAMRSGDPLLVGQAASELGRILLRLNRAVEAERYFRIVLAAREAAPDTPANIAITLIRIGMSLSQQDRLAEAEDYFRRTIARLEAEAAPDAGALAVAYVHLSKAVMGLQRLDEAETLLHAALRYNLEHGDLSLRATIWNNAGLIVQRRGNIEAALRDFRGSIAMQERSDDDPSGLAAAYNNIALTLNEAGRYAEAEPYYRKAIVQWRRAGNPGGDLARTITGLAINLNAQGKVAAAEAQYRAAHALRRNQPPGAYDYIEGHWYLAEFLEERGKWAEARSLYRTAEQGVRERTALAGDFGAAAQADMRNYTPVFRGQVRTAWALSQP